MSPVGLVHLLARRFRLVATAVVVGGVAILVGMHSHSHGTLRITDASGNTATVQEWRGGVKQGDVPVLESGTFTLAFDNTDVSAHDFVVVRTDDAGDSLPTDDGRVDLEAAGDVVAGVDPAAPGQSASRTIDLPPGHYVLVCDLPGHYQDGMYYEVVVK
jgi:hypothetical protein